MKRALSLTALLLLGLSACGPSAQYTASTPNKYPAKPAGCSFAIVTALPDAPLEQLGILDIQRWGNVTTASDFKELVSPAVCSVGGDLVVAEVNGYGCYVRGSVFRQRSSGAPAPASASGASL